MVVADTPKFSHRAKRAVLRTLILVSKDLLRWFDSPAKGRLFLTKLHKDVMLFFPVFTQVPLNALENWEIINKRSLGTHYKTSIV